jgi:hypothetical protein
MMEPEDSFVDMAEEYELAVLVAMNLVTMKLEGLPDVSEL